MTDTETPEAEPLPYDQLEWRTDRHYARGGTLAGRDASAVREFIVHDETIPPPPEDADDAATEAAADPVEWSRGLFEREVHGNRQGDVSYHAAVVTGGKHDGRIIALRDAGMQGRGDYPDDGADHALRGFEVVVVRADEDAALSSKAKDSLQELYDVVSAAAGRPLIPLTAADIDDDAEYPGDDVVEFVATLRPTTAAKPKAEKAEKATKATTKKE